MPNAENRRAARPVRTTRRRPPATIYEVARKAGVSIATVSRVQRRNAPVAEATRARVLRAIDELRYQPSALGRSLAMGRHGATGIVFPDLSGPYYSEVILGFEEQTAAEGKSVLILGTHGRDQATDLVRDLAARVDGLVVMGRTIPDAEVAALEEQHVHVVMLARPPTGGADSIRTENRQSARDLARHLLDHGHRRICFIGDPSSSPDAAERWTGFCEAFAEAGLEPPAAPTVSSFRETDGRRAALAVLGDGEAATDGDTAGGGKKLRADRPTALFCANDEIALGAYGACAELGLRIPDDIAITGWDDIPIARYLTPPLTTVRQPLRELGARAARALLEITAGERNSPIHQVLPTELVVRASCGCERDEGKPDRGGDPN
ncbi:MAG: LacI family DNA-binding transcriptional regulator [Chloroflexi bacterium]|nr:LacI family DNA-binding transcriptional regulator [Chloroflexota bacterium]